MFLTEFIWKKPVLSLYHENNEHPEREAFAVIKAKKLIVSKSETGEFKGIISDFFCLMGDIDQMDKSSKYVVCWFDDAIEDFFAGFRRLSGVAFPNGVSFVVDERDKRTYNSVFLAKHAKLK